MKTIEGLGRVAEVIPDAIIDIRYATPNNITGKPIYRQPAAYLRHEPLEALARVAQIIRKDGFRIVVHDTLRPQFAQEKLIAACPDPKFVKKISNHRRGTAFDGSLAYADGSYVDMGTDYDDFSALAHAESDNITKSQKQNRTYFRGAMEEQGYVQYLPEWYHFDFNPEEERELFDDKAIAHLF